MVPNIQEQGVKAGAVRSRCQLEHVSCVAPPTMEHDNGGSSTVNWDEPAVQPHTTCVRQPHLLLRKTEIHR